MVTWNDYGPRRHRGWNTAIVKTWSPFGRRQRPLIWIPQKKESLKRKRRLFFIFTTLASSKITGVARVHTLCLSARVYLGHLRNLKEPLLLRLAENLATLAFWNILIPVAILRLPSCVHAKPYSIKGVP